jgi:hypothetical protein
MSEQGIVGPSAGPDENNSGAVGEVATTDRRPVNLANVDTASMANDLRDLFDRVMSGQPYDTGQVRNATNLTNTIIKVLRFEFDVYKHFVRDTPNLPGRPRTADVTISSVASWLRNRGDTIEKGAGVGLWKINGRACEEKDLLTRANNMREARGENPFVLSA